MDVFCGIDWAEDHHDIALVDRDGAAAGPAADQRRRGRAGPAAGTARRARRQPGRPGPGGDRDPARAAGGLPARHRPPGLPGQPDVGGPLPGPALGRGPQIRPRATRSVLANVLRTDMHAHRPLPADTELAQAIAVLARAQQDAVWDRTTAHNKLRSHLREYFPGFLAAFAGARGGIMRPEARVILAAAPTPGRRGQAHPGAAARPAEEGRPQPRHRRRGASGCARRSAHEQMRQLPLVEQAMGTPGPGPAAPARRRLRRRGRPRAGRHRVF